MAPPRNTGGGKTPADDPNEILKQILGELKNIRRDANSSKRKALTPGQRVIYESLARKAGFNTVEEFLDSDTTVDERVEHRIKQIQSQGRGLKGLGKRYAEAQMPDPAEALGIYGYQQSFRNTRAASVYVGAEMIRESLAYGVPNGMDAYERDSMGKATRYRRVSQGRVGFNDLSRAEQKALYTNPEFSTRVLGLSQEDIEGLTPEQRKAYSQYVRSTKVLNRKDISEEARADHNKRLNASARALSSRIFQEGESLSEFAAAGGKAASAVDKMASRGRVMDAVMKHGFGLTGAVMTAARLAGPVGRALQIAQVAYKGIDAMYGPSREAASLGYGFSHNPLSYGSQVALSRGIQTQFTGLSSFGISGQQAAAARSALQGMGVGGPGSERTYNGYYRSMTDVIKSTQLDAGELAPFYEQFLRGGGQANELGKLTNLLKNDLPKAAASARMSLSAMAASINAATEAAYQSPYNSRTRSEIASTVTNAMIGAPAGTEGIASGQNFLLAARVAANTGLNPYQAMKKGNLMQAESAGLLQQIAGDMTGEEFENYRDSPQGSMMIPQLEAMTGLTAEQMQQIYDMGIGDYQNVQKGLQALDGSNFKSKGADTRKGSGQLLVESAISQGLNSMSSALPGLGSIIGGMTGLGRQTGKDTRSAVIKETGVDIYKASGAEIKDYYTQKGVVDQIRSGLEGKDLEDFDKAMNNDDLMGKNQGDEFVNKLKGFGGKVSKMEENNGDAPILGMFDLSDDAKKLIKFTAGIDGAAEKVSDVMDFGATKFNSLFGG